MWLWDLCDALILGSRTHMHQSHPAVPRPDLGLEALLRICSAPPPVCFILGHAFGTWKFLGWGSDPFTAVTRATLVSTLDLSPAAPLGNCTPPFSGALNLR